MDIHLTQGQIAVVDHVDEDLAAVKWYAHKGKYSKTFYAVRNVRRPDGKWVTERLHGIIAVRMGIVGAPDHIDRNGLNNRRDNLRPDPNGRNGANVGTKSNNTSGFKGVHWHQGAGRWRAKIMVNRKTRQLGYFEDPIEAARAYDVAALEAWGEFAVLNLPAHTALMEQAK